MKAEEMQLNDLVICYHPYEGYDHYGIIRVIDPHEGSAYPSTFVVELVSFGTVVINALRRQVKPIPITEKILANNGWEKKGIMVFKNDVIRLGWKEDGTLIFGYYEWPIKVNYVHHLQHILRDVGLVEYANSMRI